MYGDLYQTKVTVNGETVFTSRYSPCCCGPMFTPPISCFGFGFNYGCCGTRNFESGLGLGVGFAAGSAFFAALPAICRGIGNLFHKKS